ncbi:hypothetical protein BVX97_05810 [bacterium E08(2017)]|nr:hypothetical protein BVX97_05810 [bacterium E08(2017)]
MAKKPRKVYNAALGRMVPVEYGDTSSGHEPTHQRMLGEQVYFDGSDIDRLSITQQVVEHSDAVANRIDQASSERYDELLHSIYDAVLITDMDGTVHEANVRAEQMFRWEDDELVDVNIIDLISGADSELMQLVRRNVSNRKFTVLEAVCIRSDESRFNADIVVNRLKSQKVKSLCFFIRDVTLRKQAEEGLKQANEMLIEAEKVQARIDTISTLLHGFNNPLQILTCMAEMDENPEYKKQLERIVALCEQLKQEQTLEEVVDKYGDSRYDVDEPKDTIAQDMDRILVVDDEDTLRGIFIDALTTALPGKTIDSAVNGKTGVDLFAMRHHGIIIMDVSMPVMNGEEAFREIERICKRKSWVMPYVIFCTGFVISEELSEVIGDGTYHMCVQKPLTLSSLIDAVKARLTV